LIVIITPGLGEILRLHIFILSKPTLTVGLKITAQIKNRLLQCELKTSFHFVESWFDGCVSFESVLFYLIFA